MLKRITFENYKAFKEPSTIELRPITVLLGKNSSGKSSICKLLYVLSLMLSEKGKGVFSMVNGKIMLGNIYEDLFHNSNYTKLKFDLQFDNEAYMSLDYMMTAGDLILHEYKVKQGEKHTFEEYKRLDEFRGLFLNLIDNLPFSKGGLNKDDFRYSVNYIGPLRNQAIRSIYSMVLDVTDTSVVGYSGEYTPYILLESYLKDSTLINKVSGWYEANMDGQTLTFIRNGEQSGNYSLVVKRGKSTVNLADVGEGTNQLLPIITQSFSVNSDLTIIEQAGLHLHPSAHAHVAYRIAESAKASGKKYLIESHSENFVLGLRNMVAHHKLNPEDVAIYYIDHNGESATAELYEIENDGSMSDWPTGVFAENFQLLKEINKVAR